MKYFQLLLCVMGMLAIPGRADAGTLYAATAGNHGELYILDPATGAVPRDVGPLNDAAGRNYPMEGLAFQPHTRVLYGATHYSDSADPATVSKLVTINPATAEVTLVGSFYLGNPGTMADIGFSLSGGLFGISSYGPPQWYSIDIATGISTPRYPLGDSTFTEGGGIAGGSTLYVTPTASEFGIWTCCVCVHGSCYPEAHYRTISNPAKPAGGGNYGALDFDGSVLYGLNVGPGSLPQTHLVRINTSTGAVTDIGRSVDGLQAIAFVPEPGTLARSAVGFIVLLGCMSSRLNSSPGLLISNRCFAPLLIICSSVLLASQSAMGVTIDWVAVGEPGNPPNEYGQGDVPYVYRIGKYDVTVHQYVEFINQKDPTGANTLGFYGPEMSDATHGGISFDAGATDGSKYDVIAGRGNHPANYITWYDALRFANWLHNGQGDGDTENGAYTLLGGGPTPSNGLSISRNAGATAFLASEDEWIKAGHFLPGPNIYFDYPTSSNTPPTSSPPTDVVNRANFGPNGPGTVTDVGAYTGTTSPYGAFDMAGNVLQWVDSPYSGPPDPRNFRALKGLPFDDGYTVGGDAAGVAYPFIGFRVASRIPEPSAGMLALVGCGLMWWLRWRLK